MYNLGYKFEAEGCSVVVSGDTSYDEDLVALAKGVDILVLDGEAWSPSASRRQYSTGRCFRPSTGRTATGEATSRWCPIWALTTWRRRSRRRNARVTVLTHFTGAAVAQPSGVPLRLQQ